LLSPRRRAKNALHNVGHNDWRTTTLKVYDKHERVN
jgi:hypothetical protein